MSTKISPDTWNDDLQDVGLEIARVASMNGFPVVLVDRRLTRATRYHGLRMPKESHWWWSDEISEILAKVQTCGYSSVVVVGVEKNHLVATWEVRLGSDRNKI